VNISKMPPSLPCLILSFTRLRARSSRAAVGAGPPGCLGSDLWALAEPAAAEAGAQLPQRMAAAGERGDLGGGPHSGAPRYSSPVRCP